MIPQVVPIASSQHSVLRYHVMEHFQSLQTLREEIVNYLISAVSINDEVVRDSSNFPWNDYIKQMDIESTYGDKLTLRAFANIFNIEIEIVSTFGNDGRVSINPKNSNLLVRINLRNSAEGQDKHYVYLQREIAGDDDQTKSFRQHIRQYC